MGTLVLNNTLCMTCGLQRKWGRTLGSKFKNVVMPSLLKIVLRILSHTIHKVPKLCSKMQFSMGAQNKGEEVAR